MMEADLSDEDIQAYIDGWDKCPECEARRHADAIRSKRYRDKQRNAPPPSLSPIPPITTSPTKPDLKLVLKGSAEGKPQRGCRLPADFDLDEDMLRWAMNGTGYHSHGSIIRETENFVDYWRAASGRTATKRDWVAAWRNWMRRAQDNVRTTQDRPSNTRRPNGH